MSLLMVFLSFPALPALTDSPANVYAVSTEMDNRETVHYPSDKTGTTMSDVMTVPTEGQQNASMSGNNLKLTTGGYADSGFANSKNAINLANKDYVWTFNYAAPSNAALPYPRDGGFAFTLHNDPAFIPEIDGDILESFKASKAWEERFQ